VGRAILMVVNGVFTALGLWILGIPLALTLGTIAGLLNFVPNIGPIIAGVPAVLIAWTLGPVPALYVLLLYIFLQSLDGYVLTPLIQQRTVSLAPALTITAQLLFGVLAGTMGLLLATPLTAATLVLIRKLYLEDVLENRVHRARAPRQRAAGPFPDGLSRSYTLPKDARLVHAPPPNRKASEPARHVRYRVR